MSYSLYYFAGVAYCNSVRGNIFRYDASCTNCHVITDGHTRQDSHTTTNPHIIANGDWFCPLSTAVTLYGVSTMAGCVNAYIRADKAVVTNGDWGFVEYGEVEVGKEPLTHTNLLAIVAIEGLVNQNIVISDVSQETFQDLRISLASSFSDGRNRL